MRKCDVIISLKFVLINYNSQPKSQPKSAATTKATTSAAGGNALGGRAGRRGRGGRARNSRPAKKTAEELDSEMADYFDNGGAAATETGDATNGVAEHRKLSASAREALGEGRRVNAHADRDLTY